MTTIFIHSKGTDEILEEGVMKYKDFYKSYKNYQELLDIFGPRILRILDVVYNEVCPEGEIPFRHYYTIYKMNNMFLYLDVPWGKKRGIRIPNNLINIEDDNQMMLEFAVKSAYNDGRLKVYRGLCRYAKKFS